MADDNWDDLHDSPVDWPNNRYVLVNVDGCEVMLSSVPESGDEIPGFGRALFVVDVGSPAVVVTDRAGA